MTHTELAAKILEVCNGSSNISKHTNCMTRLRLHLINQPPSIIDSLSKISGVAGVNQQGEELQIILGPGKAAAVHKCFAQLLLSAEPSPEKDSVSHQSATKPDIGDGKILQQQIKEKNSTPFKLLLRRIASIFLPLIPAFIACGLITGILQIITKIDPSAGGQEWFKMMAVMGNAVFWGMNLFVGVNAAKEFGGSPIIGGTLVAIITHPALTNIHLWEEQLIPGRGGIIAVLMVTIFGAWLENKLHKIMPEILDFFITPLLVILIAGFAAILILQPAGGLISSAIGNATYAAIGSGGAFTGFILGGLWLPIVMMGIHQGFTPIHAELLNQYGVTILLPILAMAGAGQVGASLAVYFKTQNQHLKKTIASALPVGLMGVGEPLIYGVTLPLGKPFVCACIGGAFGGAVQAAFEVGAGAIGISGLPLAAATDNIPVYFMGLITAYIAGFAATWIIGFNEPEEE